MVSASVSMKWELRSGTQLSVRISHPAEGGAPGERLLSMYKGLGSGPSTKEKKEREKNKRISHPFNKNTEPKSWPSTACEPRAVDHFCPPSCCSGARTWVAKIKPREGQESHTPGVLGYKGSRLYEKLGRVSSWDPPPYSGS